MSDELLDIVDENNRPLGFTKPRSKVHREGDWHRVAHIYVVNDKAEFLVHLRSLKKDLHPGCLDPRFGGHVEAGEVVEKAVIMELREETGLSVDYSELLRGRVEKLGGASNKEFANVFIICITAIFLI